MATTKPTIVGVFDDAALAKKAIQNLEDRGFGSGQIYYSGRQATRSGFMAGLKSLFTGEDTIDNVGGVADDFTGMGFSNEETKYYDNEYAAGHALVAVRADGREQDVAQILQTNGAHIYGRQRGAATQAEYTTDTVADTQYQTGRIDESTSDEERKLRLREERLDVDKQRVQGGEVRLHKDVITEEKSIDVPVTHEEAYIERRPVTNNIDDGAPIGEGEAIRVPLSREEVNVRKNTVTTGEVAVGKRTVEETQRVSDTVRKEKARIEQQGNAPLSETARERLRDEQINEENL